MIETTPHTMDGNTNNIEKMNDISDKENDNGIKDKELCVYDIDCINDKERHLQRRK